MIHSDLQDRVCGPNLLSRIISHYSLHFPTFGYIHSSARYATMIPSLSWFQQLHCFVFFFFFSYEFTRSPPTLLPCNPYDKLRSLVKLTLMIIFFRKIFLIFLLPLWLIFGICSPAFVFIILLPDSLLTHSELLT